MQNSELNWGQVARALKDKADAMERAAGKGDDEASSRDLRNRAAVLDALAEAIWSGLY